MTLGIKQKPELRKIQALQNHGDTRTYFMDLPIKFVRHLQLDKGDFMKVFLQDNQIVLQKADI
jgi:hypothetical protein